MQDLTQIITKFENIVSSNFCHELARRVGFIQRSSSQLQGHEFAQALMIPNAFIEAETLNSLAVRMHKINKECNLSASALAQKINSKGAVAFMRKCFDKVLKEIVQAEFVELGDLKNLSGFNRVLIEDSTMVELHENLSEPFKGRGGAASKSALKINYIFDYLSEQTVDVSFFSGNVPDQSLAGRIISLLEKDDLIIRDLGYYVLKEIIRIEKEKAFHISRYKSNVDVYESAESTEPLNLAAFLNKHQYNGLVDLEVFIGKEKHRVRLIACKMNEEAVNKRLREANRTAQRSGRQVSKKKLNLLSFSIFITNVNQEMLCATEVTATYRARWRVELIFKQWKSCLKLHVFKGYNIERLYCLLYGRLIMILLLGAMSALLMVYANRFGRELSCYKLMNYIIADHAFARALTNGLTSQFIEDLFKDVLKRLCMDKRKRTSLRINVKMSKNYYKELEIIRLQSNVT